VLENFLLFPLSSPGKVAHFFLVGFHAPIFFVQHTRVPNHLCSLSAFLKHPSLPPCPLRLPGLSPNLFASPQIAWFLSNYSVSRQGSPPLLGCDPGFNLKARHRVPKILIYLLFRFLPKTPFYHAFSSCAWPPLPVSLGVFEFPERQSFLIFSYT